MPLDATYGWQEGAYSTIAPVTYLEHVHLCLHRICMLVVAPHDPVDTQALLVIDVLMAI